MRQKTNKRRTNKRRTNKRRTNKKQYQKGGYKIYKNNFFDINYVINNITDNSINIILDDDRFLFSFIEHNQIVLIKLDDKKHNQYYFLNIPQSKIGQVYYCLYDNKERQIYICSLKSKLFINSSLNTKSSNHRLEKVTDINIDELKSKIIEIYNHYLIRYPDNVVNKTINGLVRNNIIFLKLDMDEDEEVEKAGCFYFNEDTINDKLALLNQELSKQCDNLLLKFGDYYSLPGVKAVLFGETNSNILCLYHESPENNYNCISSINLKEIYKYENDVFVEIDLYTNIHYRGNKYNKLLISVLFILLDSLICNGEVKKIKTIKALAANPITLLLLLHFKISSEYALKSQSDRFDNFIESYNNQDVVKIIKDNNIHLATPELKEQIKTFFLKYYEHINNLKSEWLEIYINLDEENVKIAEKMFYSIIQTLDKCPGTTYLEEDEENFKNPTFKKS
jgi:hypothetical protein